MGSCRSHPYFSHLLGKWWANKRTAGIYWALTECQAVLAALYTESSQKLYGVRTVIIPAADENTEAHKYYVTSKVSMQETHFDKDR